MLSRKQSQIYCFCFNKSLFIPQFKGFVPINFTRFKTQILNMNDFEQFNERKRYTWVLDFFLTHAPTLEVLGLLHLVTRFSGN